MVHCTVTWPVPYSGVIMLYNTTSFIKEKDGLVLYVFFAHPCSHVPRRARMISGDSDYHRRSSQ